MKPLVSVHLVFSVWLILASTGFCEGYQSRFVPWSGYWWPMSIGGLVTGGDYNGHPAPLEKYDLAAHNSANGPAARFGRQYYYDPDALAWEGMCLYWAAASILEPEPLHKGVYNGVIFSVGDKKGLLTALYDGVILQKHQISDPKDFHQILTDFIARQGMPIIMDLGAGDEIWNHPVFKYETTSTLDDNIRHYTTHIYYAEDAVSPDYTGTYVSSATYYYYYVVDAGTGTVISSGWEGGSEEAPPKAAYEPFETEPYNPGLDPQMVREIVRSVDDGFEENDDLETAVPIFSGAYDMLAMDPDFFGLDLKAGDHIQISLDAASASGLSYRIYTPQKEMMTAQNANQESDFAAMQSGRYYLEILHQNYKIEEAYHLEIVYSLPYQGIFPLSSALYTWNGLALLNPVENPSRFRLTAMSSEGSPLWGDGADNLDYLFENQNQGPGFTMAGDGYFRVDADVSLVGLQITGDGQDMMIDSNIVDVNTASATVFFPNIAKTDGWQTYVGVINVGRHTETVERVFCDKEGGGDSKDVIELGPGEKVEYNTSYIWSMPSETMGMMLAAVSGRSCLIGYLVYANRMNCKAMIPMSVCQTTENTLVLPHVASNNTWWTGLAVMNTGKPPENVTTTCFNQKGKILSVDSRKLNYRQTFAASVKELFPSVPETEIASLMIESENPGVLSGLVLFGVMDMNRLAGFPLRPAEDFSLCLPYIADNNDWWTGIGLVNVSEKDSDVHFELYNKNGDMAASNIYQLSSRQHLALTITDIFKGSILADAGYLKIYSDTLSPLSGLYVIGDNSGGQLMGDMMDGIHP